MGRKQTRRRRLRGGSRLKSLAVLLALALGVRQQPTDAVSVRDAYTWLNTKHNETEIHAVAGEMLARAKQLQEQLPSVSVTKFTLEAVENRLKQLQTDPTALPMAPEVGKMYSLGIEPGVPGLRAGDTVRLETIVPTDEFELGFYVIIKKTDLEEGITYEIPLTVPLIPVATGGKRRKTLRRKK